MFTKLILRDGGYTFISIEQLKRGNVMAHKQIFYLLFDQFLVFAENLLKEPGQARNLVSHVFIKYWLRSENLNSMEEILRFLGVTTQYNCESFSTKKEYQSSREAMLEKILSPMIREGMTPVLLSQKIEASGEAGLHLARKIFSRRYGRNQSFKKIEEETGIPVAISIRYERQAMQVLHLILVAIWVKE